MGKWLQTEHIWKMRKLKMRHKHFLRARVECAENKWGALFLLVISNKFRMRARADCVCRGGICFSSIDLATNNNLLCFRDERFLMSEKAEIWGKIHRFSEWKRTLRHSKTIKMETQNQNKQRTCFSLYILWMRWEKNGTDLDIGS